MIHTELSFGHSIKNKLKILKKNSGNLRSPKYAVAFQILLGRPLIFDEQISYLQFRETVQQIFGALLFQQVSVL